MLTMLYYLTCFAILGCGSPNACINDGILHEVTFKQFDGNLDIL